MNGREQSRPFTDMYLIALKIGLDCSELRRIGYSSLSWLIHRYVEMQAGNHEEDKPRKATDADILALTMM